jgi:hypothetical protein
LLPILGNSQVINGKTYTPFNNFYKWRGGAFDTTLLMPQVASPNGKRAGAVYYNTPDSTVYTWTGTQWRKIGGASENNYTELIGGGKLSRNATLNRFTIGSATYYIQGQYYTSPFTQLNGFAKTPNINGRIDIVALGTTGPIIIQGTESPSPVSPTIATNRIKIGFVYYPPFDSLPTVSGNGIEAIFRKPGADSIFFSTSDTTLSIKDSIGVSVATNGLTATGKTVRLGGSLTQNTDISLGLNYFRLNQFSNNQLLYNPGDELSPPSIQFYVQSRKNRDASFFAFQADTGRVMMFASEPFPGSPYKNSSFLVSPYGIIAESDIGFFLKRGNRYTYSTTNGGAVYNITTASMSGYNPLIFNTSTGRVERFTGAFLQGSDTASLSNRIDQRVRYTDTAAMLSPYLRSNVAAATYQPIGVYDTATVVKAYVTNAEAVTITKGQVVYIFGASGDRASVKLAKNTSDTFSSKTLGIVRADIAAGAAGWITTQGQVSGINLGAYSPGDILWLDSVAGGFTKVKPVAPLHGVFVGVVERANVGNGLIYVKPQNGVEVDEIHDILITSPTNNQILSYTSSSGLWENKTFETVGNIKTGSATLDFGNTSAQNSSDLTITVTGASDGDVVSLGVPNASVNANTCFTAWVSATDTVTVRFNNYSSAAVDPASGTFKIKVFK